MKRFARLPSPALVVALAALFVSLGGVSYGVATGFIDSREIKNNTVRSRDLRNNDTRSVDIRNNEVRGRDIRASTIRGSDIGVNQVRGVDVLESSLGAVATATSADSLSSQQKISYEADAQAAARTVYDSGKLELTAGCGAAAALTLTATTAVPNATIQSYGATAGTGGDDPDFDATVPLQTGEGRTLIYTEPGGQVVVVHYSAFDGGAAYRGCIVKGLAQRL
jgi:hypothetical protein